MTEDPVTESAKAIQEASKAGGKAIDLVAGASGWISEVVGEPLKQAVGLYVTDPLSSRRFERAIYDRARLEALMRKFDALVDGEAIKIRPIPPKVGLPLIEAATMEFDEDLQTLWAKLLRSAVDDSRDPVGRHYVSILTELSLEDAAALEDYWAEWQTRKGEKEHRDGAARYGPNIDTTFWGEATAANFFRLGLVKPSYTIISNFVPEESNRYGVFGPTTQDIQVPTSLEFVVFTALGEGFCRALSLPEGTGKSGS